MGCNGSKAEDIRQSRDRRPADNAQAKGGSRPIGAPATPSKADVGVAASYHEKREADSDFLKNLVERTSQNLIDVSQGSNVMFDPSIVQSRQKEYQRKQVLKRGAVKAEAASLFAMPSPSKANSAKLLSEPAVSSADRALLLDGGGALAAAFGKISILDCGELVVSFGSAT